MARPQLLATVKEKESKFGMVSQVTQTVNSQGQRDAVTCYYGRAPSRWLREDYFVRNDKVQEVISRLGVTPDIDAFATQSNHRFARWWGPGSAEFGDAFQSSWAQGLLWVNPPFSRFNEVLEKVKRDKAHVILVMPEWKYKPWYKDAMKLRVADVRFPKGTYFFERPNARKRPTQWPVRVFLLCGHETKCQFGHSSHYVQSKVVGESNAKVSVKLSVHFGDEVVIYIPSRADILMEESQAPLRLLDLFSGTGSVTKVYKGAGFEVVTLDNDPR